MNALSHSRQASRRCASRALTVKPCTGKARLCLADGEKLSVAIKNLSESGARVEYFIRRELPELVVLIEPTLRIRHRARVVWQRDGAAGLAFEIGGAG